MIAIKCSDVAACDQLRRVAERVVLCEVRMGDRSYRWPLFRRVLRQAELMDRVMERIGADPSTGVRLGKGVPWREARMRCIQCQNEPQCRARLDASAEVLDVPDFCPNADFFHRCRSGPR